MSTIEARPTALPAPRTPGSRIHESVLDVVGETPLVRLRSLTSPAAGELVAKLEQVNPGGSIKDRLAIALVDDAERTGRLEPGGTIVEATSGNTGVGLAMVAAVRGYRATFVMPDKMSEEKVALLQAYGATVVVCPADVPPESEESYYRVAERIAREAPGGFLAGQYANPVNPLVHERTTGPEIWRATGGRIDALVAGVGTGGTITGVGRFLKSVDPAIAVVAADPEGSIYTSPEVHPYLVEGIGEDFWPATFDPAVVHRFVTVSDHDSFATARRLARSEGILVGGSAGAAVFAATAVAEELGRGARVVVILPDTGRNYLTKVHDDTWFAGH